MKQSSIDIFVIDWERSKGKLVSSQNEKPTQASVSVWRSIFMANQWNALQVRKFRYLMV
jgi:hypothetical protein